MSETKILEAIENLRKEIKYDLELMNNNLCAKVSALNAGLEEAKEKQKILTKRVIRNEKELRKRNIIIRNLAETENDQNELEESIMDLVNQTIGISLKIEEIDFVYRLGRKGQASRTRPIVLGITSYRKKCQIMNNKFKLRSIPHKIFFSDDLPKEIAEESKKLRSVVVALKQQGEDAKIVRGRIYAKNKCLSEETVNEMERDISRKKRQRSEEVAENTGGTEGPYTTTTNDGFQIIKKQKPKVNQLA